MIVSVTPYYLTSLHFFYITVFSFIFSFNMTVAKLSKQLPLASDEMHQVAFIIPGCSLNICLLIELVIFTTDGPEQTLTELYINTVKVDFTVPLLVR